MTVPALSILDEPSPGEGWRTLFEGLWPAYKGWFTKDGVLERATYRDSVKALSDHMPELMTTYHSLVELAGGSDLAARFLSLYRPPPFAVACSQLARAVPEPLLVRNYDFYPKLWDAAVMRTAWASKVLSTVDCTWGAIDGINEHGLAVSLAFGGSNEVGVGFGMPLILRYILEVATDVRQAAEVLAAVPSHMRYHVTVVDASGDLATVFAGPGPAIEVTRRSCITNHRDGVLSRYAEVTRSVDRLRHLEALSAQDLDEDALFAAFRAAPLYTRPNQDEWGTLYTAAYQPSVRSLRLATPDAEVELSIH